VVEPAKKGARESQLKKIGIRREDKSIWERRVPIVPEDARELAEQHGLRFIVQPSGIRVFEDQEYEAAGVTVQEDISECDIVFAVKEIPAKLFQSQTAYVFFAHVIKGQPYNMPMLRKLLDLGCTLIDYEKVTDDKGRRLIFFGRHAGWAGMLDTLWALGERLECEGVPNPFSDIRQAHSYSSLEEAQSAVREAGEQIRAEGLPDELNPLVVGFAGYGNVSQGAQDILDLLPTQEIDPEQLINSFEDGQLRDSHVVYKVVFKEQHLVEPTSPGTEFDLQDYYSHPEGYRSRFSSFIPYLTVLVNGIYWEEKYPRLVTKQYLRQLFNQEKPPRLRVIGDISCDVEGAIESTVRSTEPGDPVYVYDPQTGEATDGVSGSGVVIMAVDILPSELPREASNDFSAVLKRFVPEIVQADYTVPFDSLNLPPEIKRAVIAYQGALTPSYLYLEQYLSS
jgi:alpha-aminoadipic semialdehyde synthase